MHIETLLLSLDKGDCPSPFRTTLALMELLQRENAGLAEAAELIRLDPVLTAKIIQLANSILYRGSRPAVAIDAALLRIGLKVVVRLALGLSLAHEKVSVAAHFDLHRFWATAVLRAIAMQSLANRIGGWSAAEIFTLGLLCDIGSLLMACAAPEDTATIARENLSPEILRQRETACFGFDHRQLSAALLRQWWLPDPMVLAVESEYSPSDPTAPLEQANRPHALRAIIETGQYIADWIIAGQPSDATSKLYSQIQSWWFSDTIFEAVVEEITAEWAAIADIFDQTVPDSAFIKLEHFRQILMTARLHAAQNTPGPLLLVDAERSDRMLLTHLLEPAGYTVIQAASAEEAIGLVYQSTPRIILMNWVLPGMDGLDLCRRLRREFGPRLYILIHTTHDDIARAVAALEAGANDVLRWPFHSKEVVAKIAAATQMMAFVTTLEASCDDLAQKNQTLQILACKDALTGLGNRRAADDFLAESWRQAVRHQHPLSCIILDIDYFKQINDTHGHDVGDRVLLALGQMLAHNSRAGDLTTRIGGEEFLIICPHADLRSAFQLADRIRRETQHLAGDLPPITLSAGIAQMHAGMRDVEAMLRAADQALLIAKRQGRNRVVCATQTYNTCAPGEGDCVTATPCE